MSAKEKSNVVPSRKRTARACSHCRRRKSKCDGHEPCKQCSVIGLYCSYEVVVKPETGLRYVAKLEREIETLRKTIVDLQENRLDSSTKVSTIADTRRSSIASNSLYPTDHRSWSSSPVESHGFVDSLSQQFEAQLRSPATSMSPNPDSETYVDTDAFDVRSQARFSNVPYGTATGLGVLNVTFSQCEKIYSGTVAIPCHLVEALNCSLPVQMSRTANFDTPFLPPKQELIACTNIAFAEAFHLWPFLNRSDLDMQVHLLYNTQLFGQSKIDWDHLALIYSILALGKRFDTHDLPTQPILPGGIPEIRGLNWIQAARAIVEPNNCHRSLVALQTILCIAIFLSSCKALTQCAELLAYASTAAIRMGLHESLQSVQFAEQERTRRQRTYAALRALDDYICGIVSLPRHLRMVGGSSGVHTDAMAADREACVASDAFLELRELVGDAEDKLYLHGQFVKEGGSYSVPYAKLQELDADLKQWYRARSDYALWAAPSPDYTRAQLHLRYAFSHTQMMVYFPFLHHINQADIQKNAAITACCRKCVNGAILAIQTAEMLDDLGAFNEAYPLTLQILAFAAAALLVAELGSGDPILVKRAQSGSQRARALLHKLSMSSVPAAELLSSLQGVYNQAALRSQAQNHSVPFGGEIPRMNPYSNLWLDADFEGPT